MTLVGLGIFIWLVYRAFHSEAPESISTTHGIMVALLAWLLGGTLVVAWIVDLLAGDLLALPKIALGLMLLLPWLTLRLLLMPLGLVRTAYYFSILCVLRFAEDRKGGALLMAAWTLLQNTARGAAGGPAALQFLKDRQALTKHTGTSVLLMALDCARRGEHDTARTILRYSTSISPSASRCPAFTYRLAQEWLTVDAVARGSWHEIALAALPGQRYLPLTRFLHGCAARFAAVPAELDARPAPDHPPLGDVVRQRPPGDVRLVWRWLWAPYHEATWPLLQRALRSTPKAPVAALPAHEFTLPPPSAEPADLRVAMTELVALLHLRPTTLTADEVLQVCRSWDTALASPATHLQLAKRTLTLGQGDPDAALRELRVQVAAVIAGRLRESRLVITRLLEVSGPSLAVTAAHAVRTQLLEELEQACRSLHDRTIDKRALPIADEWREWAGLLDRYQKVCTVGGMAVRRLGWGPMYHEACNWAVWLWNERQEKALGNTVFLFLLKEAEELKDEGRLPLARKNAAAGG